MRGIGRGLLNRLVNDLLDLLFFDEARPSRPWSIFQPLGPQLLKTLSPPSHPLPRDPQFLGNLVNGLTYRQPRDDLGAFHGSLRHSAAASTMFEFLALGLGQLNLGGVGHRFGTTCETPALLQNKMP